jgi:glycoside/pentoside/hexuronide:cation symporter, GPH family
MEISQAGNRTGFFSSHLCPERQDGEFGGAIAGWMLAVYKFVPNIEQTATSLNGIKLMISVFPGILYMSCAILLYFYAIDHKTCLGNAERTGKRREES